MVCSIDLMNIPSDRQASRQLLTSVLSYMNSDSFNPQVEVSADMINELEIK